MTPLLTSCYNVINSSATMAQVKAREAKEAAAAVTATSVGLLPTPTAPPSLGGPVDPKLLIAQNAAKLLASKLTPAAGVPVSVEVPGNAGDALQLGVAAIFGGKSMPAQSKV